MLITQRPEVPRYVIIPMRTCHAVFQVRNPRLGVSEYLVELCDDKAEAERLCRELNGGDHEQENTA